MRRNNDDGDTLNISNVAFLGSGEEGYGAQCVPQTCNHVPSPHPSNNIFCQEFKDCFVFILPSYVRLMFRQIHDLNFDTGVGLASCIISFGCYTGDLPEEFVNLLRYRVHINISDRFQAVLRMRNFQEELNAQLKVTRDQRTRLMEFTIAGLYPARIKCDIFWTPFEELQTRMSIEVTAHDIKFMGKQAKVYFNILQMEGDDSMGLIGRVFHIGHVRDFTEYTIDRKSRHFRVIKAGDSKAQSVNRSIWETVKKFFGAEIKPKHMEAYEASAEGSVSVLREGNQRSEDPGETHSTQATRYLMDRYGIQPSQCFFVKSWRQPLRHPPEAWNTIIFSCCFFRHTQVILITIVVPIIFLALINLAIFFQEQSLSNRISSIAILLLAYTTFLPTLRNRIPPSPKITLIETFLYAIMISSTLCLLRSFLDHKIHPAEYKYDWRSDFCIIISLILLILVITLVLIGYIARRRRYSKNSKHVRQYFQKSMNDFEKWRLPSENYMDRMTKCGYIPYTNQFVRKESILYRLYMWRYRCFLQKNKIKLGTIVKWEAQEDLSFYDRELFKAVEKLYTTYKDFYEMVSVALYSLNDVYPRPDDLMYNILRVWGQSRHMLLSNSKEIVQKYRTSKNQFNLTLMKLEELMEDIEFRMVPLSYNRNNDPEPQGLSLVRKTSLIKIPESPVKDQNLRW